MIRKIRARFILVATLSVVTVLALILTAINFSIYQNVLSTADSLLMILTENGGSFPMQTLSAETEPLPLSETPAALTEDPSTKIDPPHTDTGSLFSFQKSFTAETPYETRYFSVLTGDDGDILLVDTASIAAIDTDTAISYAVQLEESGSSSGFLGTYRYQVTDTEDGRLFLFVDCSRDLSTFRSFLYCSILIALLGTIAVFFLMVFLSSLMLHPISESYRKQKRFITDASHELKTPLTIIDANTEVMEMEYGESDFSQSIHRQVDRLRSMTEKLVALSRMEEESRQLPKLSFSLSDVVAESARPYETLFASANQSFVCRIENEVSLLGDELSIRQLLSLLLDNAVKYTGENGQVELALRKKGKNRELTLKNTAPGMKKGDHSLLLERFHRGDASHSSVVSGFGIGLSLAEAITKEHGGKISVRSPEDDTFLITILL